MINLLNTLLLILLFSTAAKTQHTLKGVVVNRETGEPLPFVNMVFNERGQGLTTNLEGNFNITTAKPVEFLKLSYVGYEPHEMKISKSQYDQRLVIGLTPLAYSIKEVEVRPGINPAHRIIKEVYRNRNQNNPEKLPHFRYYSYNKMYFSLQRDTSAIVKKAESLAVSDSIQPADSLELKIERLRQRHHVFMTESVTERNFRHPNSNNEKVLASRVSGTRDPLLVFLSTQFQSFSFYDEQINLGGKNYLNPISRGSTSRHLFILEDTLFTQHFDTLFVISFRPLRNRNFDALKGVMTINSNGYAIQNVIAEPVEPPSPMFTMRVQQRYELIDSIQWFPVELNTDLYMRMVNAQAHDTTAGQRIPLSIVGVGNTYIKNIDMNPSQRSRDFSHVEFTFDPLAGERDEDFWMQFRIDSLTQQEKNTYHVIDSLGEAINLDKRMRFFESLFSGKVPFWYFNIELNRLIAYNKFEGYRLGMGLETNQLVSQWFTLGGYYAYGFNDKESKYGGFSRVTLSQRHQVNLEGRYELDVREPGELSYQKPFGLINTDHFRNYAIWRMDYIERYTALLNFRLFKNFTFEFMGAQTHFNVASGYTVNHANIANPQEFTTTEVGADIRYVRNETFMETTRGLLPLSYGFPLVWLKYRWGMEDLGGDFTYNRLDARVDYQILHRVIGKTSITLNGGLVEGDVPTSLLQFAPGSMGKFPLDATSSFAAMDYYEFVSDRYAYAFLRHDFGNLFWKTSSRRFQPKFVVVQNIGFGTYNESSMHIFPNNPPNDLSKGYFESGLIVNGLLSNPLYSLGVGAYYRWGHYSLPKWEDNIAIKLTLSMNL